MILSPSSFPIVPLAVPFWNRQTYRTIFRCLSGGQLVDGPDSALLKNQIVNALRVNGVLLCDSGSLALELALRACGVAAHDEVIVPTFCCSAVVPPILAIGATPVLADVGNELNLTAGNVADALTNKTRSVIVPHLFGNPAEIDKIVDLVRGKNIAVVDDAAQALGATIDERPVGSFGDAGIVSFGAEKVCFGIGGGALLSQRDGLSTTLDSLPASLPSAALQRLLTTLWLRRLRRWTRLFAAGFSSKAPDQPPLPYRRQNMSNLAAAITATLMDTLQENISLRRARVAAYRERLGDCLGLELIPHRTGSACLTQLVRVLPRQHDEDGAASLIAALGSAGYEVQGSYMPIHLLVAFDRCVWDQVANADRLWADLVELPCEPGVSLTDVGVICDLIQRWLRR